MSNAVQQSEKVYQKRAWLILFVLGILLTLNALIFAVMGTTPAIFEVDTGVAWSEFSTAYPTVAVAVDLETQLNGTGYFGTALFATLVTFFGFRKGERWAWYTLWVLPLVLGLGAVWFATHNQPGGLSIFYGITALIAVAGLLLPIRKFFPRQAALSEA